MPSPDSYPLTAKDSSILADYTGSIAVIEAKIIWAHGIDGE
jgi:hypothetical protein